MSPHQTMIDTVLLGKANRCVRWIAGELLGRWEEEELKGMGFVEGKCVGFAMDCRFEFDVTNCNHPDVSEKHLRMTITHLPTNVIAVRTLRNGHHALNFVKKFAQDEGYRRQCAGVLEGK